MVVAFPTALYSAIASETPPKPVFRTYRNISESGRSQAAQLPGQLWMLSVDFIDYLQPDQWRALQAFLMGRKGRLLPFTFISRVLKTPRGTATGTPLVVGAQAAGLSSISVDGWTPGITALKAGDIFKFANHSKVYMATADCVADGAGLSTLTFQPALITALIDNEGLTVSNVPFTVASDADDVGFEPTTNGAFQLTTKTLNMTEVF